MKLIFTYRPYESKFMPQINRTARRVQGSPEDHVALLHEGFIYESIYPQGVRKIPYTEWLNGREGSTIWIYPIAETDIDMQVFDVMEGLPYDIRANIGFLLKIKFLIKHRPKNAVYCSELIAYMMRIENAHEYTPRMICDLVNKGHNQMIRVI